MTRPANLPEEHVIATTCREHAAKRDDPSAEARGVLGVHTRPVHDARISQQCYRYGIEMQIGASSGDKTEFWVVGQICSSEDSADIRTDKQALSKSLPEVPAAIPIGERKRRHIPVWIIRPKNRMRFHREWSTCGDVHKIIVKQMKQFLGEL